MRRRTTRSGQQGYIMVATALAMVFMLGVSGLAIDIGRMYITKAEVQSYVDSGSLAAAMQLDGTAAGITRASAAVGRDTDKWRFDTMPFSSVTASFATSADGTYTSSPSNPANYTFVKVVANVNLPMYLIRVLSGPTAQIAASAVATTTPANSLQTSASPSALTQSLSGVFPFSPYIRTGYSGAVPDNPSDPFGYQIGLRYTLRWGSPGDRTDCSNTTDGSVPSLATNGSVRGYCCVSNSAASLRQAIVGLRTDPLVIGQNVPMDNGAKDTEMTAIANRVNLDSDPNAETYADYLNNGIGNGARVVVVPVNGGGPNYPLMGFAGFFLDDAEDYSGLRGNDSACAEYIGAWSGGMRMIAPHGSGGWRVKLVR